MRGRAFLCLPPRATLAAGAGRCLQAEPVLVDATQPASPPLVLEQRSPSTLSGLLRRLPLLDRWLPPPAPRWWLVAVYPVRLVRIPPTDGRCAESPCYGAQLLGGPD